MNKLFLITIIFAFVTFSGCKKESSSIKGQDLTTKAYAPDNRILWFDNGTNWGCNPDEPGDCLRTEVVIIATPLPPQKLEQESYFKNLILEDTSRFTKAEAHIIEGLTNGTYTVEVKYNSNDSIYYILVLDHSGNIVCVIPYNLL